MNSDLTEISGKDDTRIQQTTDHSVPKLRFPKPQTTDHSVSKLRFPKPQTTDHSVSKLRFPKPPLYPGKTQKKISLPSSWKNVKSSQNSSSMQCSEPRRSKHPVHGDIGTSSSQNPSVAEVPRDEPVFSNFPLSTILQDVSNIPCEIEAHRKLKKKRSPWSDAEEIVLKEGVRRYVRRDKQFPWGTILKFGEGVFVDRTAENLKDKWRYMCKRDPDLVITTLNSCEKLYIHAPSGGKGSFNLIPEIPHAPSDP